MAHYSSLICHLTSFLKPPSFARNSCPDWRCPWRHNNRSFRPPKLLITSNCQYVSWVFFSLLQCAFSQSPSKPCDSFSVDKSNVPQTSAEVQTGSVWVQRMMSVAWRTNLNSYQSKSIPNTVKKIWTVALGEKKKNRFVSMSIYFLNYFAEPTLFATIAAPGASPKIPCCSL